ncbi:hypothetical protein FO519_000513 [Halicephalobus sp. NKZ332]|nr:hypothetical protein FO519_000513 [Halicephalobus sp. NKZ332]
MHRNVLQLRVIASRCFSSEKQPVLRVHEAVRKTMKDVLGEGKELKPIPLSSDVEPAASDLSGVPEEHKEERIARIFRPTREATQTAWNNTKIWKIELDNRPRWENPCMGWSSTGDPLSNISMNLDFASKEDAIAFCEKNRWQFEIDEVHDRKIKPKAYGNNFSWNKKTRMALQTLEEAKEFVDPELFTVMRLLQENNGLLQSIADCQRTGRIQDAHKLQDLLQKNLVFLSNEVDPTLVAELQAETPPQPSSSTPSAPSPSRPPPPPAQQQMPQQNGHLSPYGMNHGPSPQMRNGPIHTPPGPQDPQAYPPQQYQMPPSSMMHPPNGYYGPPPQAPYMNGHPPMGGPSPQQTR